jgi:hypothetical protein
VSEKKVRRVRREVAPDPREHSPGVGAGAEDT